jgi:hypothetical protein
MDPDFSPRGGGPSFEFAFNEVNFSDRELRIEVVSSDDAAGSSGDGGGRGLTDWARQRKRRREELLKEKGAYRYFGSACGAYLDGCVSSQSLDCCAKIRIFRRSLGCRIGGISCLVWGR